MRASFGKNASYNTGNTVVITNQLYYSPHEIIFEKINHVFIDLYFFFFFFLLQDLSRSTAEKPLFGVPFMISKPTAYGTMECLSKISP